MKYNIPKSKDMAILIPYFNFTNSVNIENNIKTVIDTLKSAEIPFYIGEILFNDQKSVFVDETSVFSFKTNSIMFYKENIINVLEKKISPSYKYICMLDADIIFDNNDWYQNIIDKLKTFDICQPFEFAVWLNKEKEEIKTKNSILRDNLGHPGFVWAFKREWLTKYKLFDLCLIGGGDRILSSIVLQEKIKNTYVINSIKDYLQKIPLNITNTNIKGKVYHLYHGNITNRQYFDRYRIISHFLKKNTVNNNISQLITTNSDGIYEWNNKFRLKINAKILEYFINRKDDE